MKRTLVVVLLISFSGCVGEEAPGTAPATAPAAQTTTADSGVAEIEGEGTPLDPGTYTYSPFEPAVTFELGSGWEGGHTLPEFFDVWRGMRVAVILARPDFLIEGGRRIPAQHVSPDEAIRLFRTVGRTKRAPSIVLDGGAVPSIYLTTSEPTPLFGGPDGEFSTEPSHRLRIAALEVDGTLVLVMVSAKTPVELQDRAAVTEMLGTIDFQA